MDTSSVPEQDAYPLKNIITRPQDSTTTLRPSVVSFRRSEVEHGRPASFLLKDRVPDDKISEIAHLLHIKDFAAIDGQINDILEASLDVYGLIYSSLLVQLMIMEDQIARLKMKGAMVSIVYKCYAHASNRKIPLDIDLQRKIVKFILNSKNINERINCMRLNPNIDEQICILQMLAYRAMTELKPEASKAQDLINNLMRETELNVGAVEFENCFDAGQIMMLDEIEAVGEKGNQADNQEQIKAIEKQETKKGEVDEHGFQTVNIEKQKGALENPEAQSESNENDFEYRYWMSFRIKFESLWRCNVSVFEKPYPFDVKKQASQLIAAIIAISIQFKQFEYGWYWYERASETDWKTLVQAVKLCRAAPRNGIWPARCFAIYNRVFSMCPKVIKGSSDYPLFMLNFSYMIRETNAKHCISSLTKVCSDMLSFCSHDYFPLTDSIISLLVGACLDNTSQTSEWMDAFRMIFKVYDTHKHALKKDFKHTLTKIYFSADTYIDVLKLCTISGRAEEFKFLNKQLQEKHADKEYIDHIKKGYMAYVKGEVLTDTTCDDAELASMESLLRMVLSEAILSEHNKATGDSIVHRFGFNLQLKDTSGTDQLMKKLLKSDSIPHYSVPIQSYSDFREFNNSLVGDDTVHHILCVNVGGMVDISTFLTISAKIYIMDSHQPLNLHNCFGSDHLDVVVFVEFQEFIEGEGEKEFKELQSAFEELEFDDDEEDEEGESSSDDDTQIGSDNEDVENQSANAGSKRKKDQSQLDHSKRIKMKERRTKRRMYQRLIAEYYSEGTSYSAPVCKTLYSLAVNLVRDDMDMLWLGIVSMTSHYLLDRMDQVAYEEQVGYWKLEVERVVVETPVEAGQVKSADDDSISFKQDMMQLMLLKHWNLYDSLFHSAYVATRIGIWKEKGRQRLGNLLVKMGLPQKESKQNYEMMDTKFKSIVAEKLMDLAPKYNMENLRIFSFEKNYGFCKSLSAPDVVYSLIAILDAGASWLEKHGSSYETQNASIEDTTSDVGLIGAGIGTKTAGFVPDAVLNTLVPNDPRSEWLRNFYLAFDALEKPAILDHGIMIAIHYQKILVQTGINILEKKQVKKLSKFSIVIMDRADATDVFGYSIALLHRLAAFLMDAYKEYKNQRTPFILAAPNSMGYMVLGRPGLAKTLVKNPFGLAFIQAANESGIETINENFDNCVVGVSEDDLSTFLEQLQLRL